MSKDYYKPSDDTFLLSYFIKNFSGENALEIAAGTGYVSNLLKEKFGSVVATDINPVALKEVDKAIIPVCCDSASAITNTMFDLIVMNPPYLPSQQIHDIAVDGGKDGIEVTLKMLGDAIRLLKPNGTILLVTSSLANYKTLLEYMHEIGCRTNIVGRRKISFEELLIVQGKLNG